MPKSKMKEVSIFLCWLLFYYKMNKTMGIEKDGKEAFVWNLQKG